MQNPVLSVSEADRPKIVRGWEVEGQRLPSRKYVRITDECTETEINFTSVVLKL